MAWTHWRQIAMRSRWSPEHLDWNGPACYELAIAGPRGGNLTVVYVGETVNERTRIVAYASHGSHLSRIIAKHLRDDWSLYYRAQAKHSKAAAAAMQNALLAKWDYPWNILLNGK